MLVAVFRISDRLDHLRKRVFMFPDTKPQKISADVTAQSDRTTGIVRYRPALVSSATTRSEMSGPPIVAAAKGNSEYRRDMGRMTNLAKAAWLATLLAFVLISGAFGSNAHAQTGAASFYKSGSLTANGEKFDPQGLTAAHRSLSFDTRVRVTSVDTGRSVVVRINDRGPFVSSRIIDLSFGAARVIDLHTSGVANVSMEVLH